MNHLLSLTSISEQEMHSLVENLIRDAKNLSETKFKLLLNLYHQSKEYKPYILKNLVSLAADVNRMEWIDSLGGIQDLVSNWKTKPTFEFYLGLYTLLESSYPIHACHMFFYGLTSASKDQVKRMALVALKSKSIFNFDEFKTPLESLKSTDPLLLELIDIFKSGNVSVFKTFSSKHSSFFKSHDLNESSLLEKLRVMGLSSLSLKFINKPLTFKQISSHLEMESSLVEALIIQGMVLTFFSIYIYFYLYISDSIRIIRCKNESK